MKNEIKEILEKIDKFDLTGDDLGKIIPKLKEYIEQITLPRRDILNDSIKWIEVIHFLIEKYEKDKLNISGEDWKKKNLDFSKLKRIIDELDWTFVIENKIWTLGGGCFFKMIDKKEFINFLYSKLKHTLEKDFIELMGFEDEKIKRKIQITLNNISEEEKKLLIKIYIGQKINEGILIEFKDKKYINEEKELESLIEKELIKKITPYKNIKDIVTAITLISGAEISQQIITSKLRTKGEEILKKICSIPQRIIGLFLCQIEETNFILKKDEEDNFIFDIDDFILNNEKVFNYLKDFCKILIEENLAVETNSYVSSKGGRVDSLECIICPEVRNYLINRLNLTSLTNLEEDKLNLIYSIYVIKDEIIEGKTDEERKRNDFWELLKRLPFDEVTLKENFLSFEKERIITPYKTIHEDEFLFKILDEKKYMEKLTKIMNDFIDSLSKSKFILSTEMSKDKTTLKLHSELFSIIGEFETLLRNTLIEDIKLCFNKKEVDWEQLLNKSSLVSKLKEREKEDTDSGMIPEKELIYYADILDYKEIITDNWEIFNLRFSEAGITKEQLEKGLIEINRIRRKVMHLRDIKNKEADILKLFVIPKLRLAI